MEQATLKVFFTADAAFLDSSLDTCSLTSVKVVGIVWNGLTPS